MSSTLFTHKNSCSFIINLLYNKFYRDNCLLVHQMQQISSGALGRPALQAARHAAAKHGVTHIVWADSPSSSTTPSPAAAVVVVDHSSSDEDDAVSSPSSASFADMFQSCPVPMALATLGGTFVDCNERFCQATGQTRDSLLTGGPEAASSGGDRQAPAKTIFNLTAQDELQTAFDQISDWLTPSTDAASRSPIVLKTTLMPSSSASSPTEKNLRLCLTPVQRPQDQTLRFLCVTVMDSQGGPLTTLATTGGAPVSLDFAHSSHHYPTKESVRPKADFLAVG